VTIPNVIGQTIADGRAQLEAVGLKLVSGAVPDWLYITEIEPGVGQQVAKGSSVEVVNASVQP
jgi:beta-lactam-binding protein with PASTA domain